MVKNQKHLKEIILYDPLTGDFFWKVRRGAFRAGSKAGHIDNTGYLRIRIGKLYQAHRLAWLYCYGYWPKKYIDHIDGNKLNNKIENLRDVSHTTNVRNAHKAKGYSWMKSRNKYIAYIVINKKQKHLGYFENEKDARRAYLEAKEKYHNWKPL